MIGKRGVASIQYKLRRPTGLCVSIHSYLCRHIRGLSINTLGSNPKNPL
jgi:hypothetical protein